MLIFKFYIKERGSIENKTKGKILAVLLVMVLILGMAPMALAQSTAVTEPGAEDQYAKDRARALQSLEEVYTRHDESNYTPENWKRVQDAYQAGVNDISASTNGPSGIIALNAAIAAINEIPASSNPPVTVCVTMEKFTLGQGYIIEPTLVTVPKYTPVSRAITDLLKKKYPDVDQPWKMTGEVDSAFYLSQVYDPDRGKPGTPLYILDSTGKLTTDDSPDWLGEFDYYKMSGWMYCVDDAFPGYGADGYKLAGGEVVRWQFTLYGYGADLGADNSSWGAESIVAHTNRDRLTYKIAELNAVSDKAALEKNATYTSAMDVLQNIESTQAEVDAALAALAAPDTNGAAVGTPDSTSPTASAFDDVKPDAWYGEAVVFAAGRGLIEGIAPRQFGPGETLRRAMVLTILHRQAGQPVPGKTGAFNDVEPGIWYAAPADWAAETGLTAGIAGDGLKPNQPVTREELVVILSRFAGQAGLDTAKGTSIDSFADAGQVSELGRPAFEWACAADIIQGNDKNELSPNGKLTRAECATMLMRFVSELPTA